MTRLTLLLTDANNSQWSYTVRTEVSGDSVTILEVTEASWRTPKEPHGTIPVDAFLELAKANGVDVVALLTTKARRAA
jgi:hypothetical protein